ncbi:hypothetical protein [Robiginitalea sp. SC105]|uniref:hypothetical protein n=1 Tax=Robiginitalea sp. SC105 TaxID=2762332 RepID=UPI00163A5659|nr:hypothetical protein [Robiginitalea sp. SC105]MBC2839702.1 hypothetical protein [Robiginitalea sp. SC105]
MKTMITILFLGLLGNAFPADWPVAADAETHSCQAPEQNRESTEKIRLHVLLRNEVVQQTFQTGYVTEKVFENLELPFASGELKERFMEAGLCKVSITVTVRVGIDSSYAEASMTVSDVDCDQVAATIRRMKNQLLSALK